MKKITYGIVKNVKIYNNWKRIQLCRLYKKGYKLMLRRSVNGTHGKT